MSVSITMLAPGPGLVYVVTSGRQYVSDLNSEIHTALGGDITDLLNMGVQAVPSGGTGVSIGGAVTGGTDGALLYVHPGAILAQDPTHLSYDPAQKKLKIGNGPDDTDCAIQVSGSGYQSIREFSSSDSGTTENIQSVGNTTGDPTISFSYGVGGPTSYSGPCYYIYNNSLGSPFQIDSATNNVLVGINLLGEGHNDNGAKLSIGDPDPTARLTVNGTIFNYDDGLNNSSLVDIFVGSTDYTNLTQADPSLHYGTVVMSLGANPSTLSQTYIKSRSTNGVTHGKLLIGDQINSIDFVGDDGTDLTYSFDINCIIDDTVSGGIVPSALVFSTYGFAERLRIASNGNIGINDPDPVGLFTANSGSNAQQGGFFYEDGSDISTGGFVLGSPTLCTLETGIGTPYYNLGYITQGAGYIANYVTTAPGGDGGLEFDMGNSSDTFLAANNMLGYGGFACQRVGAGTADYGGFWANATNPNTYSLGSIPNSASPSSSNIPALTWDTSGNVLINQEVTSYNSIATTGWGVPAIYKSDRATAQTAAKTLASYTVGAAGGTFEVSANLLITTSTLHNFTVTCSYTDENNTARIVTMPFSVLAGTFVTAITNASGAVPYEGIPLHIRCKGGTAITLQTTGTFTTVTYNFEECIKQLA